MATFACRRRGRRLPLRRARRRLQFGVDEVLEILEPVAPFLVGHALPVIDEVLVGVAGIVHVAAGALAGERLVALLHRELIARPDLKCVLRRLRPRGAVHAHRVEIHVGRAAILLAERRQRLERASRVAEVADAGVYAMAEKIEALGLAKVEVVHPRRQVLVDQASVFRRRLLGRFRAKRIENPDFSLLPSKIGYWIGLAPSPQPICWSAILAYSEVWRIRSIFRHASSDILRPLLEADRLARISGV